MIGSRRVEVAMVDEVCVNDRIEEIVINRVVHVIVHIIVHPSRAIF